MKRTIYIGSRLTKGTVSVAGHEVDPKLPPGCAGVMFAYESAEAATAAGDGVLICAELTEAARPPAKRKQRKGARS